LSRTNNNICPC